LGKVPEAVGGLPEDWGQEAWSEGVHSAVSGRAEGLGMVAVAVG